MAMEMVNTQTLSKCLDLMLDERQSVQECLDLHSNQQEQLLPLLDMAVRLRQAGTLTIDPDFRLSAKARLINKMGAPQASAHPQNPASRDFIQRILDGLRSNHVGASLRFAGALVLVFILLASFTLGSAANQALPGDALYPLKTQIEQVQLSISPSENSNAWLHLEFSGRRMNEIEAMLDGDRTSEIPKTAQAYIYEMKELSNYLSKDTQNPSEEQSKLATILLENLAGHQNKFESLLNAEWESGDQEHMKEIAAAKVELQKVLAAIQLYLDGLGAGNLVLPTDFLPTIQPQVTPLLSEFTPSPVKTPTPAAIVAPPTEISPAEFATQWATNWPTEWPQEPWTVDPSAQWTVVGTPWTTYIPPVESLPTIIAIPTVIATYLPPILTNWPTYVPQITNWPTIIPPPATWPTSLPQITQLPLPPGFIWPTVAPPGK